jgi:DNA topoisomerase II
VKVKKSQVSAKSKDSVISFYSLPEYEEWIHSAGQNANYSVKYYKGLGTNTSAEGQVSCSSVALYLE